MANYATRHFENSHYVDPAHISLCHKQFRLYVHLAFQKPPLMIAELRPRRCSWRVCAANACHSTSHNSDVCFFRFTKENDEDRCVLCTNCVIHESYVSQRLTNLCFVTNPICHSPTGGRPTVTMMASHLSFI